MLSPLSGERDVLVDEEFNWANDGQPLVIVQPAATEIIVRRDTVPAGVDASCCPGCSIRRVISTILLPTKVRFLRLNGYVHKCDAQDSPVLRGNVSPEESGRLEAL
jgi:hypothetical protein